MKIGVIPSVFCAFPSHLIPKTKTRRPPTTRSITLIEPSSPIVEASASDVTSEKTSLKRKLDATSTKLVSPRKKIKVLLQARRRLRKRNAELKTIITDLRKQALISSNSVDISESCAGGIPDLFKRQKAKFQYQTLPTTYSPELRSFALTLHFYSPCAYNYVRKVFETCLPYPRTISRWYQSVDDAPGFTKYAFNALKMRSEG